MSKYIDMAKELRMDSQVHYNCAQSVIIPFAKELGYDEKHVYDMGRALGAGLRAGETCGAIVGGLMVLGIYEQDDPGTVSEYYKRMKENHEGMTRCSDLLKANKEKGEDKKTHCDNMVYESINIVTDILKEKGVLKG